MILQMSGHERPPFKPSKAIAALTAAFSLSSLSPISWPSTTTTGHSTCSMAAYADAGSSLEVDTGSAFYKSIMTIQRTRNSLGYILEDIANKGDAASIVSQVKFLVKNYQLSSNVQTSVGVIKDRKAREEATTHGKAAVEFLAQIYEYFSDQVDDLTGANALLLNDFIFSAQGEQGGIRPLPRGCCTSIVTIHALSLYPYSTRQEVSPQGGAAVRSGSSAGCTEGVGRALGQLSSGMDRAGQ